MTEEKRGLKEKPQETATLERQLHILTLWLRDQLDTIMIEPSYEKRRTMANKMAKAVDEFREKYKGQIPEKTDRQLDGISHDLQRPLFVQSIFSPEQKAMNASCKYNKKKINETVGNAWIQDEDQYIQMGEEFDRKINSYNMYTQKLFLYIVGEFYSQKGKNAQNSHDPDYFKSRKNSTFKIGLSDFFKMTGEDVFLTADRPLSDNEIKRIKDNRKNAIRKVRDAAKNLLSTYGRVSDKRTVTVCNIFEEISIPRAIGNIETTKITVNLSEKAAQYYSMGRYVVTTHSELYSLPNTKDSRVSFALGMLISQRYYTYKNHQDHNNPKRLLIGKQLSNLPLPGKNDTDKPRRNVVIPVMEALEQLIEIDFLSGFKLVKKTKSEETVLYSSYTEEGSEEYNEQREFYNSMTYEDLAGAYLDFDIANPKDISEAVEDNKKKYDKKKKADERARQKKAQK